MSAEAVAQLRQIWEKLTFAKVNRVIAREPEDVLFIEVPEVLTLDDGRMLTNHMEYRVYSNRTADIRESDRWRAQVSWRHYYGFTDEGIYFQKDDYREFDFDISLTFTWSEWGNHTGGWDKPDVGTLLAGEVIDTPRGKRFRNWFVCTPELKFLFDIVLHGTILSEEELAPKLVTGGFPDTYWALARLVLFDNVQPFVDEFKEYESRPQHPCFGQEYPGGRGYLGDKKPKVDWRGMYLPENDAQYVHELSYQLNEPKWWEEFQRLAAEQNVMHEHPALGGYCKACEAEKDVDERFDYDYWGF